MASGYYFVLAFGAIALMATLIGPLAARQVQPVRIKSNRPLRRR